MKFLAFLLVLLTGLAMAESSDGILYLTNEPASLMDLGMRRTQERLDASLSAGTGSHTVNAEIQSLKSEVFRLRNEIATFKKTPALSKQAKLIRKARPMRRHPKLSGTPKEYNQALAAYKAGK